MIKLLTGLIVCSVVALSGCASHPKSIAATDVSPLKYQDASCKQLAVELDRIERKTGQLYASLAKTSDTDTAQAVAGVLLLWPMLFFLEGGDGPEAAEYAHLQGELKALQSVTNQKECGFDYKEI